eukprot:1235053-Pyramimonas_sp.AAC.1
MAPKSHEKWSRDLNVQKRARASEAFLRFQHSNSRATERASRARTLKSHGRPAARAVAGVPGGRRGEVHAR